MAFIGAFFYYFSKRTGAVQQPTKQTTAAVTPIGQPVAPQEDQATPQPIVTTGPLAQNLGEVAHRKMQKKPYSSSFDSCPILSPQSH
jgi:hypothetical protein